MEWPHTWFGFWREMGPAYSVCPSIYDWIDPEAVKACGENLPKMLNYLRTAPVAIYSGARLPNLITGQMSECTVACLTDGTWVWLENLAEYIEQNNVAIPQNFYAHMERRSFIPPDESNVDPEDLDWPSSMR